MKFVREASGEMRWKQKIKVAGNVWVFRVTCKREESGLTFIYRGVPKMCIFLLCVSPLIDFYF